MALHSFDFYTYLEKITGVKGWDVDELPGGAANFTVRVRRQGCDTCSADEQKPPTFLNLNTNKSMIIKQAPAYLGKVPEMAFSPYRQTIEAEALVTFHTFHPSGLQNVLVQNPCIHIPKLFLLDKSANILVQSDLGPLPNLYDVLISSDTMIATASVLGRVIGHFLADMHNSLIISPSLIDKYYNADAERLMEATITQATGFLQNAGVVDAQILGKSALNHWRTRKKTVFGQGDLWFGTLLVSLRSGASTTLDVAVGICDWEFAGPNDPAADIAQIGSYLHLLSICPLTTSPVNDVILTFAESLYPIYFASLKAPPDQEFLKSLLTLHGWEMVNAAGWSSRQDMWCPCQGQGVRCTHIRTLIQEGAKLLRAANDSDMNLEEIPWSRFLSLAVNRPS